ncbi:HNH endonuclease [Kineococcus arenarius]|uniref:HNH endonuclease n=1 Tax=Kineococcus sp. SYSU DK007 TaxID=3383128 RepID=UPI003D7D56C2
MTQDAAHEERELRQCVMDRLTRAVSANGGVISREELSAFDLGGGTTRRLVDASAGIWNPKDLKATLSIVSSPDGPYDDRDIDGGLFRYDYRAGSTQGQNTKLRRAMELGLPIILLRKIAPGVFVPVFPVYVVEDDRKAHQFVIALDESLRFLRDPLHPTTDERRYAERITKQRLHQPEFRGRVIQAYSTRCAVCRLAHGELLDAAHIVDDSDAELGQPVVSNGLSLCTLHHRAYDHGFLGITPDYEVRIDSALLDEVDGPVLRHGLQEMHRQRLQLPARRADHPDPERLAWRWEKFGAASA